MTTTTKNNPFIFDPTRHGYDASADLEDFTTEEAYEMGVSAGWDRAKELTEEQPNESFTREMFPGILDSLDKLTIRPAAKDA